MFRASYIILYSNQQKHNYAVTVYITTESLKPIPR